MSHTVKVTMTADQCIFIRGKEVNIHDIQTIFVNGEGLITDFESAEPQDIEWIKASVWKCPKCGKLSTADYATHDQQVQEEFAEKCIKEVEKLKVCFCRDCVYKAIRAMAGEEASNGQS